jgi:drug/metabolite transporter (DMT)-like permease
MRGFGLVGMSAVGFGLMPLFAVHAYGDGLNVPTLLFLRFAVAAAIFLPCARWYARRHGGLRLTRRSLLHLALLGGVLYAAQSALYFSAVHHISPALAALLLYLYPALVACGSALLGKERLTLAVAGSIAVTIGGVALALGRLGGGLNATGITEAVGAAVVYTVYILYGNRVSTGGLPSVAMTGIISLFAALSFLGYGAVSGQLSFAFHDAGWVPVICVALASTVVAILCFFAGMALIGPVRTSLASMLEPVVSIVAAAMLLPGGALTALQFLGAGLVLAGAAIGVLSRRGTPDPLEPGGGTA